MTPPTNPHAELVEALRPTNGWTYIEKYRWRCTKCAGPVLSMCGPPSILSHFADCPIRLALEYTPPPAPKLTPLPKYSASVVTHSDWVRNNYEALKHQQENTVKSQSEPAFALQERSIESKVNWLIEKFGLLTGLQSNVGSRLDTLESNIKHHESGIDEYGNPLTDTFADRLRHLERKVFQLETEQSQRLGSLLEARDKQDTKPKPACDKCGDTKIINETKQLHFNHSVTDHKLCPCVKVGDVVSRDVAMLLPIHSKVRETTFKGVGCAIKVRDGERAWAEDGKETGFDNDPLGFNGPFPLKTGAEFVILRIGPAPTATTDHIADASKKVADFRLADLLADPRLRPYWDVIKAAITCRSPLSRGCDISVHVDALPPELRAAIEGVR